MNRNISLALVLLAGLLASGCLERHVLSLGAHTPGQAGASGTAGSGAAGDSDEDDTSDNDEEEQDEDEHERP